MLTSVFIRITFNEGEIRQNLGWLAGEGHRKFSFRNMLGQALYKKLCLNESIGEDSLCSGNNKAYSFGPGISAARRTTFGLVPRMGCVKTNKDHLNFCCVYEKERNDRMQDV